MMDAANVESYQSGADVLLALVGETHGTSGQRVSFSLIDAGSVLLPA